MSSHKLLSTISIDSFDNTSIVEIGSAREAKIEDTSTFYFEEISKIINSEFYSVDFSEESNNYAKKIIGEKAIFSDGEIFLKNFNKFSKKKISILYLDNFDVIYNDVHKKSLMKRVGNVYEINNEDLNNERSAIVHLNQLKAALPFLNNQNVIIIDDTKYLNNEWWGKGALVIPFLLLSGYKIVTKSEDGILMVNY
jgi:hypothetical protein